MDDLYSIVDKYFLHIDNEENSLPGIFYYEDLSNIIKTSIRERKNLGFNEFSSIVGVKYNSRILHFTKIILKKNERAFTINKIIDCIRRRLMNIYYGVFAEAILEGMYYRSKKFKVISLTDEDDYENRIDLRIQNLKGQTLDIQVKSISHLVKPTEYQKYKLFLEQEIHSKANNPVIYAYFNHNFEDRYFIIDGLKLNIFGYGLSNIKDLDYFTQKIFNKRFTLEAD